MAWAGGDNGEGEGGVGVVAVVLGVKFWWLW